MKCSLIPFQKIIPQQIAAFDSLEKIHIPKPSMLMKKISSLRRNPSQIDILADFDFTITKHKHNGQRCDSLFGMWTHPRNSFLPPTFREELLNTYLQYGPYETDPTLSFDQKKKYIDTLYTVQTKFFQKYSITVAMAERVLNESRMVYRAQTNQFLKEVCLQNIQLYIVSGGISDIIYHSLRSICGEDVSTTVICSNEWELYKRDDHDCIRFRPDLVHSYNKHKKVAPLSRKKHCLLLGDLGSDREMARTAGYKTVLSIFYGKEADTDQRAIAQNTFDIIVEGDASHKMPLELIKLINRSQDIDWRYLYNVQRSLTALQN